MFLNLNATKINIIAQKNTILNPSGGKKRHFPSETSTNMYTYIKFHKTIAILMYSIIYYLFQFSNAGY